MLSIFSSNKLHAASWALNHNFWAFSLYMIIKLSSSQMLKFFLITNITTEFWAIINSMLLKFK